MVAASGGRPVMTEEEREDLRRFWSRVAFALGMGGAFFPLAVVPGAIQTVGIPDALLEVLALVLYELTMLPASVLAFWHRRLAAVWLFLAGIAIAAGLLAEQHFLAGTKGIAPDYGSDYLFVVPLILGGFGLATELMRWPPLLERPGRPERPTAGPPSMKD